MSSYHLDATTIDLTDLGRRLESTDLIPSQQPLLEGFAAKSAALRAAGVHSLADLRLALKTSKSLAALAAETNIDAGYPRLLKRTIEGFFPKPRPLKDWDWLPDAAARGLAKAGIANTRQLFEATCSGTDALARDIGVDVDLLAEPAAIADLCRIQWASPNFARALVAAGKATPEAVAKADPDALYEALIAANEGARFYKGKVGLRDVRRLVAAAAYVP